MLHFKLIFFYLEDNIARYDLTHLHWYVHLLIQDNYLFIEKNLFTCVSEDREFSTCKWLITFEFRIVCVSVSCLLLEIHISRKNTSEETIRVHDISYSFSMKKQTRGIAVGRKEEKDHQLTNFSGRTVIGSTVHIAAWNAVSVMNVSKFTSNISSN